MQHGRLSVVQSLILFSKRDNNFSFLTDYETLLLPKYTVLYFFLLKVNILSKQRNVTDKRW